MGDTENRVLLKMLRTLRNDLQIIEQKGAGYYSCSPFIERYNKLLDRIKEIFSEEAGELLKTFQPLEEPSSADPSQKMKTTQRLLIEIGQLATFMEEMLKEDTCTST